MSEPQRKLIEILKNIFPGRQVINEHSLGSFRLDIFIPSLRLAFEYDGPQHTQFIPFFHGSMTNFLHGFESDYEKERLCAREKIVLIRIANPKQLTKEFINQAINSQNDQITQAIKEHKNERDDENIRESEERHRSELWREARRAAYSRVKDKLKDDRRRCRQDYEQARKSRLAREKKY